MARMKFNLGGIAYLLGIFGALLMGLLLGFGAFVMVDWIAWVLILAGVVIGFMNIAVKEKVPVMLASLVLGAGAGVLATFPFVGTFIASILSTFAYVVTPIGIVVAFFVIWDKAQGKKVF